MFRCYTESTLYVKEKVKWSKMWKLPRSLPSPPLSSKSRQSIIQDTSQEHWKRLWTGGHYALISQQWMPAAASLNLSRWFQYVVNKILMQAMVPIVAGIQLQSCPKNLWQAVECVVALKLGCCTVPGESYPRRTIPHAEMTVFPLCFKSHCF